MKEKILAALQDPEALESLYREDEKSFAEEFYFIFDEIKNTEAAAFWKARLDYKTPEKKPEPIANNSRLAKEVFVIILLALMAAFIAKIHSILNLKNPEIFYGRYIGFIIFPAMSFYFIWKRKTSAEKSMVTILGYLLGLAFIFFLPSKGKSDTFTLSCIHLPFFLWFICGLSYINYENKSAAAKLRYIWFNGNLVIISTLILIAGVLLTFLTLGLFGMIGVNIESFYMNNIVVSCIAATPVIASCVVELNFSIVDKITSIIARIFSPLVLITLACYLVAMTGSTKSLFQDRDFLLLFNVLLIGVMGLIIFSLSEKERMQKWNKLIVLLLSGLTIIVNAIALAAICYRLTQWGITPNRISILMGNILIFCHLIIIAGSLFKDIKGKSTNLEKAITFFLPAYFIWAFIVTFLFPFVFGFR